MQASQERSVEKMVVIFWMLGLIASPVPGPFPTVTVALLSLMGWSLWLAANWNVIRFQGWRQGAFVGLGILLVGTQLLFAAHAGCVTDALLLAVAALIFVKSTFSGKNDPWGHYLATALVAGAVLNSLIAFLQALFPQEIAHFGGWMAGNAMTPGRAGGNLVQPNQLAMLINFALVMLWFERARLFVRHQLVLTCFLGAALAWTGSRTGYLCLMVVTLCYLRAKKNAPKAGKWRPVLLVVAGSGLGFFAQWLASILNGATFFLSSRVNGGSDITSSRSQIWADVWHLIQQHPMNGIGWGQLNRAWTFSDLPERGHALLGHAHNVLLHWMVELGWPVAVLLAILFLSMVVLSYRQKLVASDDGSPNEYWVSAVALSLLAIHSLLEYPLWYVYFLLPAAFWLGCLGRAECRQDQMEPTVGFQGFSEVVKMTGAVVLFGCIYAVYDYMRIVQVYEPFGSAKYQPLTVRIDRARDGLFFGVYADLAYVLTQAPGKLNEKDFERPLNHLINPALLKAYAEYLHAHGEDTRAREAVVALKKFNAPVVLDFFKECEQSGDLQKRAFQCVE